MQIDRTDIRILEALQSNGRQSNVELASAVGLSPSPCLARVRNLENSGLISRYVALLDPEKLGPCVSVFIQLSLEKQSDDELSKFELAVRDMPEVMECYLMTGDADYLIRVLVRDTVHLRGFILDSLTKLRGIAQIRSSFALKQVVYRTSISLQAILPKSNSI